jgi:hypothetical protein
MRTFCTYKVRNTVTAMIGQPTTTLTFGNDFQEDTVFELNSATEPKFASDDGDLEEEITDNHDDTFLELYSAPEQEFASEDGFADEITDTTVQATALFPSKHLNKMYQILFYNTMDLVSTGESKYGEITKAGIVKNIALIK